MEINFPFFKTLVVQNCPFELLKSSWHFHYNLPMLLLVYLLSWTNSVMFVQLHGRSLTCEQASVGVGPGLGGLV